MAPYQIRLIGDPVLKQRAREVTEIDDALVRLTDDMLVTMYDAPGVGLAAPQVGVQKRLFVYDWGEGPGVLINPVIRESDGEWWFEEGCRAKLGSRRQTGARASRSAGVPPACAQGVSPLAYLSNFAKGSS